jgi:hypothetical protein
MTDGIDENDLETIFNALSKRQENISNIKETQDE